MKNLYSVVREKLAPPPNQYEKNSIKYGLSIV